MKIVLKLLYHLSHAIYTLYELLLDSISVIRSHFRLNSGVGSRSQLRLNSGVGSRSETLLDGSRSETQLISDLKRRVRIPGSIAFVVSRGELEHFELLLSKLGRLIHWSAALNVPHITVFDETGLLTEKRHELLKHVQTHDVPSVGGESCKSGGNVRVTIKNGSTQPYYKLQISGQDDSFLRFLSNHDGRNHVIRIAQRICYNQNDLNFSGSADGTQSDTMDLNGSADGTQSDTTDTRSDSTRVLVSLDRMSHAIQTEYNFPDPDLILRTSSTPSIFSFCPWQMRLSEILFLPDHPSLDYVSKMTIPSRLGLGSGLGSRLLFHDFLHALSRFSLCEQRFGK